MLGFFMEVADLPSANAGMKDATQRSSPAARLTILIAFLLLRTIEEARIS
jgi:hypothetical protein